ncbi:FAD dependent oxidoreductase-domain-containing protein, partial [Dunaliella salina]
LLNPPPSPPGNSPVHFAVCQVTVEDDRCANLARAAVSLSSMLQDSSVTARQACNLPVGPDAAPVIGAVPGVQGVYVATGHSCWGILNGPATGKALAEQIVYGRSMSVDLKPFSPARFL